MLVFYCIKSYLAQPNDRDNKRRNFLADVSGIQENHLSRTFGLSV